MSVLEEVLAWKKRLDAERRVIACSPGDEARIRAALEDREAYFLQVIPSVLVPSGTAYVFSDAVFKDGQQ